MVEATGRLTRPVSSLLERLPEAWRWGLQTWFLTRLLFGVATAVLWGFGLVSTGRWSEFFSDLSLWYTGWKGAVFGAWLRWDTVYYLDIARQGYTSEGLTVFFPLFPILARSFNFLGHDNLVISLFLVSNIALLLALVVLYQIVEEEEYSPGATRRTLACLALFPTSLFLIAPNALALTLLMMLLAYQAARRSQMLLACLASVAAGLAHPLGMILAFFLAYEAWKRFRRETGSDRWMVFLTPLAPLLGSGIFLSWRVQKGFPSYPESMQKIWSLLLEGPWQPGLGVWQMARLGQLDNAEWISVGTVLLAIAATVWAARRLSPPMLVFQMSALVFMLLFIVGRDPVIVWGGVCLLMFPLFVSLALWFHSPRRRAMGFVLGMGAQVLMALAFFSAG